MASLQRIKISAKKVIAPQVYLISFKRTVKFKAGQIIGLTNDVNLEPRLYSICSSPHDDFITILFIVKESGKLTPSLSDQNVGDTLWMTPVQGKFTYDDKPAWWIATGTGIAPFYSMFKNGQTPLKLIQGGRRREDFYFSNEFSSLVDYVQCSSLEIVEDAFYGRLTLYLTEMDSLPTDINYYLCGSAEMVVDVRNLLIARGVPFEHIITEIYF